MQAFELLLRLSQMTRIVDRLPIGIGQELLESQINTDLLAGWDVLDLALGLYEKLNEVAIGPAQETYPLDVLDGEGFDVSGANQTQASNSAAIGETDMSAIWLKLPSRLLVLHAAAIMLKLGIAALSGLLVAAVLIEASDGRPGTISGSLPGLGVETSRKGVLFRKFGGVALQIVSVRSTSLHPEAQAFVAHKLRGSDRLIDGAILGAGP